MRRSWLNIDSKVPPPPYKVQRLDELLPGIMQRAGLGDELFLQQVNAAWVELVGESLARHSRPGTWRNGCLTIYVMHSLVLQNLPHEGKVKLLNNLRERFGKDTVRRVQFQLDPDGAPRRRRRT